MMHIIRKVARNIVLMFFSLSSVLALLAGCASYQPEERERIDLVWPLPPAEPRIRYVNRITGLSELQIKTSFADAFFGGRKDPFFRKPHGVAVDRSGRIYVTDSGRVWVMDLKKKSYGFIGDQPGEGRLTNPIGIGVSSDGRVFVTDTAIDKVFVYDNGRLVGAMGDKDEFQGAVGIAIDDKRELLFIVDAKKHSISVYSLKDYRKIRTMGRRGTGDGEFNYPTNVEVDSEGRLYIVDTGNFRVQIFDDEGKFIKSLGQIGDTPGSFARPKGIALDSEGHIYVVDAAFQNFQIFDFKGNILLAVGSGGTAEGEFLLPSDITIDDDDMIYVVNQGPPHVQIFEYLGRKKEKREAEKRW